MFNRSEVIVLTKKTNKQTPVKTYTSLHYTTPVGNNVSACEVTALLTLLYLKRNQLHADMHNVREYYNSKNAQVHLVHL